MTYLRIDGECLVMATKYTTREFIAPKTMNFTGSCLHVFKSICMCTYCVYTYLCAHARACICIYIYMSLFSYSIYVKACIHS